MLCEICQKEIKGNRGNLNRHYKSKKHIRLEQEQNEQDHKEQDHKEQEHREIYQMPYDKLIEIIEKQNELIETFKKQFAEPSVINNTTNITNTINNTININVYGQEDFKSLLSPENIKELKGNNLIGVVNSLLRIAYVDREENRNIKYTNTRSNKCKVLTESGWEARDINKVFGERLLNVGELYPITLGEYDDAISDDDVDDLLVMTQDVKQISNHGTMYVHNTKDGMDKNKINEAKTLRSSHLNDVYNSSSVKSDE